MYLHAGERVERIVSLEIKRRLPNGLFDAGGCWCDLPGMAEMKAAGLLSRDLPPDFDVPNPAAPALDEDPLDSEAPDFHVDFVGEDEGR